MANGIANAIAQLGTGFKPVSNYLQGRQMGLQNRLAEAQIHQATGGMGGNALSPEMQGLIRQTQSPDTRSEAMNEILARNPELGSKLQSYYGTQREAAGKRRKSESEVLGPLLSRVQDPQGLERALSVAERRGVSGSTLANIREMWSPETKDLVLASYGLGGGGLDKDTFNAEDKLRSQFLSQAKDFKSLGSAYRKIVASAKNPSPAGDVSLIYGYMKMLDPGSTVMEGEQASARNAAGVPDRIRAMYNSVIGGGSLASSQRADFLNRATDLYQSQADSYESLTNQYSEIARRAGVDPRNVIVDVGVPVEERTATEPQPGRRRAPQQGGQQTQQAASPTTQAEYDALPSGALFVDPDDGKTYRKP